MTETIRGELIAFRNAGQDFWGFGRVRTLHQGGEVAITGKLLGANIGDTVELTGDFTSSPKYGRQFKVRTARVVLPSDQTGVVGWLAAKLPQISARRAEQLVEKFGVDGLWARLDAADYDALCTVDGITLPRAREIVEAYATHKADRDRFVRFKQWGLTDSQIATVVKLWGDDAEEHISQNPYQLMEHARGFGWKRADAVAMRMGVRRDDPARLAAGLMHAMETATQAGHCFAASGMLVTITANKICGISDEHAVRRALEGLIDRGKFVRIEQKIYPRALADAEGTLATVFAKRARESRERGAA